MTRTGLKPLLSTTLVDQAYEQLLERIASGQIAEGEKLVIDHIAKEFGVSLIPVREALARLLAENVVEYSRNKGYRVSPRPSAKEHSDIFTMRSILEAGAVRHGFQNVTAEKVEQLRGINAQIGALRRRK